MSEDKAEKEFEYKVSEKIDEYSEKITSREFSARVTLEGVFKGITRIMGSELNKFFDELIKSSANTCMYYHISLRRRTGQWDEVIIVMCGNTIIGLYGVFLDNKVFGKKALSELIDLIKKNTYKIGIIELIELGKELVKKFIGYSPTVLAEKTIEEKKTEKIDLGSLSSLSQEIGLEETLQLERIEYSSTQPVDVSEVQNVLPERILSIYGMKRPVEIGVREKHPIPVEEALKYDKLVFKFNDSITNYMDQYGIIVSKVEINGDDKSLNITAYITKLRKASKEDLFKYANDIAEILTETISEEAVEINRVTVTIKHGLYTIKVSKTLQ
ncbi:MAG: hypothetical protein DRJ64_09800 [Thermoprotei archaeon]|nr:MAG: hypothetical protein DRJ64_09800 [Thermoprotei archaeon]